MRKIRAGRLGLVLLMLPVATCATPPKQTAVDKSRTYAATKDAVWEDLLSFFTTNNIQIKTIEKVSGVIYAERSGVDRTMADCGEVPLATELSRAGTLNVFVRPLEGKTQVTVNVDFTVLRMFDNKSFTAPCYSTGALERLILDSIQ
jgi:hypothetical protein